MVDHAHHADAINNHMINLNELEFSKQARAVKHPTSLEYTLHDHGWHILGTGIEAVVARHPHRPYALKLFPSNSKYVQFVKLAQQHHDNPHFVRFSRYLRPVPGTEFSYVRMEILHAVTRSVLIKHHVPELCVISNQVQRAQDQGSEITWNSSMNLETPDSMLKLAEQHGWSSIQQCAASADPAWTSAVAALLAVMTQHGYQQLDLHYGNMMQRGTTLVITDPFY